MTTDLARAEAHFSPEEQRIIRIALARTLRDMIMQQGPAKPSRVCRNPASRRHSRNLNILMCSASRVLRFSGDMHSAGARRGRAEQATPHGACPGRGNADRHLWRTRVASDLGRDLAPPGPPTYVSMTIPSANCGRTDTPTFPWTHPHDPPHACTGGVLDTLDEYLNGVLSREGGSEDHGGTTAHGAGAPLAATVTASERNKQAVKLKVGRLMHRVSRVMMIRT